MTSSCSSHPIAAASIAVVRDDGAVLLVLRGRGAAQGTWAFPGGGVDPGETTAAAALRELAEETGIVAQIEREMGRFAFAATATTPALSLTVFQAVYVSGTARAGDDARDVVWTTPQDALTLPLAEHMAEALQRL